MLLLNFLLCNTKMYLSIQIRIQCSPNNERNQLFCSAKYFLECYRNEAEDIIVLYLQVFVAHICKIQSGCSYVFLQLGIFIYTLIWNVSRTSYKYKTIIVTSRELLEISAVGKIYFVITYFHTYFLFLSFKCGTLGHKRLHNDF